MRESIAIIGLRGYPAEFPGAGGIDFYIQKILPREIKKRKHTTLYVRSWAETPVKALPSNLAIIKIPTFNSKHLDTPIYAFLASFVVCFTGAEIVWYQAPGSALFLLLPKLCGKKIYITLHGVDWKREKWGWVAKLVLKFAEWLSVRVADRLFVVSQDLQDYVQKNFNKTSELMAVDLFKSRRAKPKQITSLYGLRKQDFILYLGRFVPEKRIEWLIRAFIESDKLKRSKLVLAGKQETNSYNKSLIKETKNQERIIWTGFVRGRVKSELLSNCKVFVLPSSIEGNSMALIEAISYDRTCLVSSIRVHRELSRSKEVVMIFDHNSYRDFLKQLEKTIAE